MNTNGAEEITNGFLLEVSQNKKQLMKQAPGIVKNLINRIDDKRELLCKLKVLVHDRNRITPNRFCDSVRNSKFYKTGQDEVLEGILDIVMEIFGLEKITDWYSDLLDIYENNENTSSIVQYFFKYGEFTNTDGMIQDMTNRISATLDLDDGNDSESSEKTDSENSVLFAAQKGTLIDSLQNPNNSALSEPSFPKAPESQMLIGNTPSETKTAKIPEASYDTHNESNSVSISSILSDKNDTLTYIDDIPSKQAQMLNKAFAFRIKSIHTKDKPSNTHNETLTACKLIKLLVIIIERYGISDHRIIRGFIRLDAYFNQTRQVNADKTQKSAIKPRKLSKLFFERYTCRNLKKLSRFFCKELKKEPFLVNYINSLYRIHVDSDKNLRWSRIMKSIYKNKHITLTPIDPSFIDKCLLYKYFKKDVKHQQRYLTILFKVIGSEHDHLRISKLRSFLLKKQTSLKEKQVQNLLIAIDKQIQSLL